MKHLKLIAGLILFLALLSTAAVAQRLTPLVFNKETRISLGLTDIKEFTFEGKRGDYWQVIENDSNEASAFFELYAPNGGDVLEDTNGLAQALILPADGKYTLRVFIAKGSAPEGKAGPFEIAFMVSDTFALPKGSKLVESKRISGHIVNIYSSDETFSTALEILKNGKRLVYLLGETTIPFQVNEGIVYGNGAVAKREKRLWATADKTGDGVPDIAVQYFSGGAHCCFDYRFYELGSDIVQRPTLYTADSGVRAMQINPGGGIRIRTSDMSFAYWNIHFAGSPAPSVVIDFKNGAWRPNFSAMKKRPPTAAKLKAMATKAKRLMNDKPYKGDEFAGIVDEGYMFEEAFWGTMLDLIYTGNEKEAWKFFDDVWPKTKPGKERFIKDFKEQLGKSEFWKAIVEDNPEMSPSK